MYLAVLAVMPHGDKQLIVFFAIFGYIDFIVFAGKREVRTRRKRNRFAVNIRRIIAVARNFKKYSLAAAISRKTVLKIDVRITRVIVAAPYCGKFVFPKNRFFHKVLLYNLISSKAFSLSVG